MRPAVAMQFQTIPVSATEEVIEGRGPIIPQDADRLIQAIAAHRTSARTLLALALDSGGGNVVEAEKLVGLIQTNRLTVIIPHNSQCASACFLLLSASPRRLAATDALIGVHSASENGAQTDTARIVTTYMAQDAARLGVPTAIIGKMIETTPGRVTWLEPGDLAMMQVTVFDGDALTALRQDPGQYAAPARPAAPASDLVALAPAVQPAAAGRSDRLAWDTWLAGQRGAYRDGAKYAHDQMMAARPVACLGPGDVNRGDFTLGCDVAQRRLAKVVNRIRSSTDYAAGWSQPAVPAGLNDPVEQQYKGVYFCATQISNMVLKIYQGGVDNHRRGLLTFSPHDNARGGPSGSFAVEGSVDPATGTMALTPVNWVSTPAAGYQLLGLAGRSDDGGKTFEGRVTNSTACTRFTLARMAAAPAVR